MPICIPKEVGKAYANIQFARLTPALYATRISYICAMYVSRPLCMLYVYRISMLRTFAACSVCCMFIVHTYHA